MDTTTSSSSPSPRRRKEIVDRLRYKTIEGIERIIDRLRLDLAEASRRERDELAHQILPRNGGSEADMALGSPAPAARVDAIRSKIRNRQALMERVRTGEFPPTCQECEDDLPVGRITSPDTLDPNRCVDCASLRERTRKR